MRRIGFKGCNHNCGEEEPHAPTLLWAEGAGRRCGSSGLRSDCPSCLSCRPWPALVHSHLSPRSAAPRSWFLSCLAFHVNPTCRETQILLHQPVSRIPWAAAGVQVPGLLTPPRRRRARSGHREDAVRAGIASGHKLCVFSPGKDSEVLLRAFYFYRPTQ